MSQFIIAVNGSWKNKMPIEYFIIASDTTAETSNNLAISHFASGLVPCLEFLKITQINWHHISQQWFVLQSLLQYRSSILLYIEKRQVMQIFDMGWLCTCSLLLSLF